MHLYQFILFYKLLFELLELEGLENSFFFKVVLRLPWWFWLASLVVPIIAL